jgi:non-lysosomal glucosylceramidase
LTLPLDRGHLLSTLRAIHKHNFRSSLWEHANPQRSGYAMGDEAGLLLCSWPRGGKPSLPFVYSDEVWTGVEYQAASHMIARGLLKEGLELVEAARSRHDGLARNPWNEYECGSFYARSMSSWALLEACSGFSYSAPAASLCLAPKAPAWPFTCFFSTAGAWGSLTLGDDGLELRLAEGRLRVETVLVTHAGGSFEARPGLVVEAKRKIFIPLEKAGE